MSASLGSVLAVEAVLLALWASGWLLIWRKSAWLDRLLWAVLWFVRVCGSLCGARQIGRSGGDLILYLSLQSAAALLLLAAMLRAELRVCRERLSARVRERIRE